MPKKWIVVSVDTLPSATHINAAARLGVAFCHLACRGPMHGPNCAAFGFRVEPRTQSAAT